VRAWERRVGAVVMRVVGVVLVATVALVLVRPRYATIDLSPVWVVVGLLASFALALALRATRGRRGWSLGAGSRWASWSVGIVVAVVGGVVARVTATAVSYRYGWDASVTSLISQRLSRGHPPTAYQLGYLSRYPFNLGIVAVDNVCRIVARHLGTQMYPVFIALNAALVGLSVLLVYVGVRLLRGHRAAVAAQLVVVLLLALSPWVAVPYTDVLLTPFATGGVVLVVAGLRARRPALRWAAVLAGSAVLAVGYALKHTTAAAAIAVLLVLLLRAFDGRRLRRVVTPVALAAAAALVFGASAAAVDRASESAAHISAAQLDPSRYPPSAWWIAMGLTTSQSGGRVSYGGFSSTMVRDSRNLRGAALQAYADQALHDRLAALGAGGLAAFLVDKQAYNWGDGMFYAWGEGLDTDPGLLLRHDGFARSVQRWDHPGGSLYVTRASLTTGLWLALLLWAGVGLLGAPYRRETLLVAVVVLGIMGFTLLVQGRSRYLLGYLPITVIVAAVVDPGAVLRHLRKARPTPTS